jgi:cold shock CspA family protein
MWQGPIVGHVCVALASPHEATLEPEHPARSGNSEWLDEAHQRLHRLHQVGQNRQGRLRARPSIMQGVIKAYDPVTGDGLIMADTDLNDYELATNALDGSIFRMLRQGQRVVFDIDDDGRATRLRLGSEVDMQTPGV